MVEISFPIIMGYGCEVPAILEAGLQQLKKKELL